MPRAGTTPKLPSGSAPTEPPGTRSNEKSETEPTSRAEMRTCALPGCDASFEVRSGGRPRLYCSPAHRSEAHKLRHAGGLGPDPETVLKEALAALAERRQRSDVDAEVARVRAELSARLADAESTIAEIVADRDELLAEHADAQARICELEDELERLRLERLESEAKLRATIDAYEAKIADILARTEAQLQERDAMRDAERSAWQHERTTWLSERETLTERIETLAATVATERERSERAERDRAECEAACERRLAAQAEQAAGERNELMARLDHASAALAERDDALARLKVELEGERARCQACEAERAATAAAAEATAARLAETSEIARAEASRRVELERLVETLEAMRADATAAFAAMQETISALRRPLDRLARSDADRSSRGR